MVAVIWGRTRRATITRALSRRPSATRTSKLKQQPTEYLKQLYFDALVFTPEALRHLVAQVGASQVMLGSDEPYIWNSIRWIMCSPRPR